jgi:hypothetical protein
VRYRGTVRSFEARESEQSFYKGEPSDFARYQIIDFSQARAGELVDADFDLACALDIGASSYLTHQLVTFVVSNLDIFTQTLNYIERAKAAGCTWSFRIFTNFDDARSWIMLELGHH